MFFVTKLKSSGDEQLTHTALHPRPTNTNANHRPRLFVAEHDDHHLQVLGRCYDQTKYCLRNNLDL